MAQRRGKASRRQIKALACLIEQGFRARQGSRKIGKPLTPRAQTPGHRTGQDRLLLAEPTQQIHPHRHRAFGRSRRRGCAVIACMIDQGRIGLMPHSRDQRDRAFSGRAHHDFLVETPKILKAATTTGDDDQIGARDRAAGRNGVETTNGAGDLGGAIGTLHGHGPNQHLARKAVAQAVQDIADHSTRGGGDDTDHAGQKRQRFLAGGIKQPFGCQHGAALFQHGHQRTRPRRAQILDHHLVFRLAGEGRQPARDDHLHPLFGWMGKARGGAFPDHGGQNAAVILEVEIDMTRTRQR